MQPKPAMGRIALMIDVDCDRGGHQIGAALENAGYEVVYVQGDGDSRASSQQSKQTQLDPDDVVLRLSVMGDPQQRSGSGFLGSSSRGPSRAPASAIVPAEGSRPGQVQQQQQQHQHHLADEHTRQAERIESIAQLAGGIAHELNNILSVVSICSDEVLETMATHDANRECLLDIRHAVDRGAAVTRDLLAFSRRDVEVPRVVDFNDIITDSQRVVARILGDDVALHLSLAATDAVVRVDAAQWTSLLLNLAVNARQSIDARSNNHRSRDAAGSLTLRTRDVVIDPWTAHGRDKPKGRYVELEVTDTGCAIPADIQARIFEPFFQSPIGKSVGSGLGLSVVHGVVERSAGFIDLVSPANTETQTGTTFKIYVPIIAQQQQEQLQDATGSTTKKTTNARLMIVEDEEAVRRVALKTLERQGYTVLHAASAEDALELLERSSDEQPIDLIITDVILPGMDGRQLANAVTSRYPNSEILYTSGYTDDESLRIDASQAEVHFLQKPYTAKLLVARVEEVLTSIARRRTK